MAVFEVGKFYVGAGGAMPLQILRRTDKTVWVRPYGFESPYNYKMKVHRDDSGDEFVVPYIVPKELIQDYKFSAQWEITIE